MAQGKQEEKIVYFIHADYIQIPAYKYKIGDNQSFIAKFVVVYVLCTCAGACAYGTYPYNIFHWNIYCTIAYTHIQSHNKCSQRPRCCYHFIGVIAVSFYQITENDRTWWKSGFIQCTFGVVESVVYFTAIGERLSDISGISHEKTRIKLNLIYRLRLILLLLLIQIQLQACIGV